MQRRFRGIGARKGHRGFSWDSLEGLNSSDGRKQNETADCPEAHAESKHGAPEGGHTELWLQIFRDGGRILARRWRGLERQRAAERVFSFSKAKKAGAESGCQSYLEMCAAQSSQKRRDEKISRNSVCLSRLVKLRERLCCSPAVKCPYGCFNERQCVPSSFWTPLSSIVQLAAVLQAGSSGGVGFVWFFFYVKLKLSVEMFLNQQRRKYFFASLYHLDPNTRLPWGDCSAANQQLLRVNFHCGPWADTGTGRHDIPL